MRVAQEGPSGSEDGRAAAAGAERSLAVRRYVLLTLVVAVFAGSLLLSFERIQRQHGLDLTVSRVSLWSVSQADIELQRLLRAVDGFVLGRLDREALLKRFEVFRTRLPALAREGGPSPGAAAATGRVHGVDGAVPELIERLEALRAAAEGLTPSDRVGLAALHDGLAAFERPLERLTIAAFGQLDEHLVTGAREQGRYTWPMLHLLGILVSGGVLVTLLLRETGRARRAQEEGRAAWAQLKAVIDAVPALIGVTDRDHRYRLMNRYQARFLGVDDGDATTTTAAGRRVAEVGRDGDEGERLNRQVVATRLPIPFREESRSDHDGRERTWLTTRIPVLDATGEVAQVVSVSLDITERKLAEARIAYLAHHDSLTELPNRLLFNDRLAQALHRARRAGAAAALHCIDLDHFKLVNDTLGHATGDATLRAAAERMRGCLRDTDTLARLGGDEFAVIQPDLQDERGAALLAERLVEVLHRPIAVDGRHVVVGASVGVALYPRDGVNAEQLLRSADLALYDAKARGRDRFRLFAGGAAAAAATAPAAGGGGGASLADELRRAIAGGEFELEYHPELALPGRRPVGLDARPCWRHPRWGRLTTAAFLPAAERCGLLDRIYALTLRAACAQSRAWRAAGLPALGVAVELCPAQLADPDLVATVRRTLAETGLGADGLELAVGEPALRLADQPALATLERLRGLGVRIALRRFGTDGGGSVAGLRRFPFDAIKLDPELLATPRPDRRDGALLRGLVDLAHDLDMAVVAEGVETAEQVTRLEAAGCDRAQGPWLAPAQPAAAVEPQLRRLLLPSPAAAAAAASPARPLAPAALQ